MSLDGPRRALIAWDVMLHLDGDEYMTVKEAARLLGVKPATLYAYVSRGVLRSYRQGIKRERLYRRTEVEALLRLAPAGRVEERARVRPDIPLAESWIRD
jgi:excisionase family DNA binding protein